MLKEDSGFEVSTGQVNYFENVKGFYAKPAASGNYPGVVMIHEWWGLNENIKDMAEKLAGEGYRVLAADLYNGKIAADATEARQLTGAINKEKALENMIAAADYLRKEGSGKVASLGWCFGGGKSLEFSLSGEDLDATVIYYGNLVSDEKELAKISWPVLGIFGDKDQSIPVSNVQDFEKSLNSLMIENEIYIYPGVGHAFANPSGESYAPEETKDAWDKTLTFFSTNLK